MSSSTRPQPTKSFNRKEAGSISTATAVFRIRHHASIQCLVFFAGIWLVAVLKMSHQTIVVKQVISNDDFNRQPQTKQQDVLHIMSLPSREERKKLLAIAQPQKMSKVEAAHLQSEAKMRSAPRQRRPTAAAPTAPKQHSPAWDQVLQRAKQNRGTCKALEEEGPEHQQFQGFDGSFTQIWGKDNQTLAALPAFGIIQALEHFDFDDSVDSNKWQCELPPETECEETQLTVIVMAYNPDRLEITLEEIKKLLSPEFFHNLIKECILVWNGPRSVDESPEGRALLQFAETNAALRVEHPLKMGFPNDLMNRYHPDVVNNVTTKALLYYDDDGPFYSYKAIQGGFELWKRHARAQIGAMARQINLSERQMKGKRSGALVVEDNQPNDRSFVTHCDNLHDQVAYNFYYFANYDANMVLPSGSMLHSNYLCFLWHPALHEIRQFVLDHPVHPDDITVSTVVSHLAGRAPRVYSRSLQPANKKKQQTKVELATKARRRRLLEDEVDELKQKKAEEQEEEIEEEKDAEKLAETEPKKEAKSKGAGIGGICWDCDPGMTEKKKIWADLRGQAINTLIRYFGSINSGSIGWCDVNSEYYAPKKDGRCKPIMARQGWLPWMNADGTPKETCP